VYKGHKTRQEYLQWCQDEWDKNNTTDVDPGRQTINHWANAFTCEGAVGTCDIFAEGNNRMDERALLVFGYVLSAKADDLASAFADGLRKAIEAGWVSDDQNLYYPPLQEKAPRGNTGLGSSKKLD
jgi:hypothetical protein